ncbi:MAG: potassium-transporting ATPase subunit KdpB [Methanospirillum sp.]|nr:potassium-transporting ATPase subunit KdpB [Methanospirillum sp.]
MSETRKTREFSFQKEVYMRAAIDAFLKLDPRQMVKNPVVFTVEAGSLLITVLWLSACAGNGDESPWFTGMITIWLWFTVLFANFAEALAEGRGKAQAQALKQMRQDTPAHLLPRSYHPVRDSTPQSAACEKISSLQLKRDDLISVSAGEIIPVDGTDITDLAGIAQLASLADETPEGRSIVVLVKERYGLRGRVVGAHDSTPGMEFIPFSSHTRMSGVNTDEVMIRKGAAEAVFAYIREQGNEVSEQLLHEVEAISRAGGTPLVVAKDGKALGVIYLKDIVKGGIKERFAQLRHMGIRTVMITGDNRLTAATIAAEAGVDDFLAEATPESKLNLIREYQEGGRLVAMTGDGTNDAPALAQADVAVAMNTGTQPAREAANMVDLDSNPTKLIEIVEIGKQLLMTRGALTTFSIANDLAKYFAIIPTAFVGTYPALSALNFMDLHQAILSAVIFNALIIIALVPLALRGVKYKPMTADEALRNNILLYGAGGVITPFLGIKIIDLFLVLFGMG